MTELVAVLGFGKGTWSEVAQLVKSQPWERVFLVTDEFGAKFNAANAEMIVVNLENNVTGLRDEIIAKLKGRIKGMEVAVNLSSGTGKEHMALLGALLKMGAGLRIVVVSEKGYAEI